MKKLLEAVDIAECGVTEGPITSQVDSGQPVSMNVSLNASGTEHVADLIDMMKNAGLGAKEEPSATSLGMRGDIEKFRGAMPTDDPDIPGRDDDPSDMDINQGIIGAIGGGALGSMAGSSVGGPVGGAIGGTIGSTIGDKLTGEMEENADPKVASMIAKFVDEMDTDMMYYGEPDVAKVGELIKQGNIEDAAGEMADAMADQDGGSDKFDMVMQRAQEYIEDYMDNMGEGYANEPEPEYGDMQDAIPNGNDLNRKKKAYAATQDGDNPMAVETIKAALMKALSEKKAKPDYLDFDGDGNKKEPMKKALKDKKKKTNEAEFKKTGRDGDGSSKFDEMGCKKEMMKLNASGCAKMEMYKKVSEKYGCSKGKFEKLYASHCG